jgi:hypothetical protein
MYRFEFLLSSFLSCSLAPLLLGCFFTRRIMDYRPDYHRDYDHDYSESGPAIEILDGIRM